MPTSLRFYRGALGFEVVGDSGGGDEADWVLLRHGHAEIMLNAAYERNARPDAPDPARLTAHADTAVYVGCPDLYAAHAHLTERGLVVEPPFRTGYGFKALGLRDPDNYAIVFFWPATHEGAADWRERYGGEVEPHP